jgi:hypothetical protein
MMKTGLLWADFDPNRSVSEKIALAVEYYHQKNERWPNCCYINPETLGDFQGPDGLKLVAAENILRNHFWVGREETEQTIVRVTP